MTIPGQTPPPNEAPPGEGTTLPYGEAANTSTRAPDADNGRRALHWKDGDEGAAPPPPESSPSGSWVMPADLAQPGEALPSSASSGSWIAAAGEAELNAEREKARDATPYPPADQGDHNGIILTLGWIEQVLQLTLPPGVEVRVAGVGKKWKLCVNEKQIVDVVSSMAHYVRKAMPDGGTLTVHCMPMNIKPGETATRLGLAPGKYVFLGISHTQRADAGSSMSDKPTRARLGLDTCFRVVGELGGSMSLDRKSQGITALNIYLPAVD